MEKEIFTRDVINNTAFYNDENYYIVDVNEQEQLFQLSTPNGLVWVRTENTTYIPF